LSITLTIAGILQALSWTIAGAIILVILSITTLAPSRNSTLPRSTSKKVASHSFVEARPSRERTSEKQPIRTHQTPSRQEPIPDAEAETPRPSTPAKPELQKLMIPKITPPKTIPANASPTKLQSKTAVPKQESFASIPLQTRPSPLGPVIPLPPKQDSNVKIIEQGDYQTVDLQLDRGTSVTCAVVSSAPVNVYILDDENLTGLDLGEEFWSETGEEGVSKASLSFIAPQTGKWFLVVENTDNKQVSATIDIKKNQTRRSLKRSPEPQSS
jgi:hypothetical protein